MRAAFIAVAALAGCGGSQRRATPVVTEPPGSKPTTESDVDRGTFVHFVDGAEVGTEDFVIERRSDGWGIRVDFDLPDGKGSYDLSADRAFVPVSDEMKITFASGGTMSTRLARRKDGVHAETLFLGDETAELVASRSIDLYLPGPVVTFFVAICHRDASTTEQVALFPGNVLELGPATVLAVDGGGRRVTTRELRHRNGDVDVIACEGERIAGARLRRNGGVSARRGDDALVRALTSAK